tara:strand:- start:2583 stop:2807 length:225 start_codon:yes stop_codon:yes gene_type:complete
MVVLDENLDKTGTWYYNIDNGRRYFVAENNPSVIKVYGLSYENDVRRETHKDALELIDNLCFSIEKEKFYEKLV